MAKKAVGWAVGTMRDGIRKTLNQTKTKAAGREVYAYKVPYRDGDGKQTSQTWDTLTQAKEFRDLVRGQKNSGILQDFKAGRITVSAWGAEWLSTIKATRRPSTHATYRTWVNRYILPELGGMTLNAVTPHDIQRAVNAWATRHGLSAWTVRLIYRACKGLFQEAADAGRIPASPCRNVRLPEVHTSEVVPFTVAEVEAIAEEITPRYRLLVVMGACLGLRIGELLGLTWDRIDLEAGTVSVDRQLQDGRLSPAKTRTSIRRVPLSQRVITELRTHRDLYPPQTVSVEQDGAPGRTEVEPVFRSPRGGMANPATVRYRFRKACTAAGLRPEVPHKLHNLRHTFASVCIEHNTSPKKIQTWMGHASISVTMDVYGHLMNSSDDSLRSAMDAAFGTDAPDSPGGPDAPAH
ncbi:integrase [Nocardiopsis mwathae]|uniref:Integrase n=1 Tax=Nocardiopsis mwathae TaxID=1472723 RepID=A0A7X0D537_9ACTN|nr:tyrosine-type recombinase/integrase [Nocardiopsis mwathae]MBB6170734.1 integrase [Nocardiopsis mwathae]